MNTWLEDVRAVLSTTPERWQQLVGTLPVALLTRPPAAGEWSALGCLQHLLDTERLVFQARFYAFLAGRDLDSFDPNQPHSDFDAQTPSQLAAAFAHNRQASLALLKQVKDDDLARTAQRPQLGTVTLAEHLHNWATHDLNHTIQAERALIQPFLIGCGAFRIFYRDQEVRVPE